MADYKPTLCIDFDGVIHSYASGWNGANRVDDPPVPGAIEWLHELLTSDKYVVCIYSSRSKEPGGIEAMQTWLQDNLNRMRYDYMQLKKIEWPTEKPAAYLTIDDRAICFRGTFPSQLEIDSFKPWNK